MHRRNKIKENPKNLFSYIRAEKNEYDLYEIDSGKRVGPCKEMAVLLNDFFSSVFTYGVSWHQ